MNTYRTTMDRIASVIRESQVFLITTHVRLDGDAVGSELALADVLRNMGKEVTVYNQDETPAMFTFLPGEAAILHEFERERHYDAVFFLDCSDSDRAGDNAALLEGAGLVINIDHHVSNDGFAAVSLVDPTASSTGELLYRLFVHMNVPVTAAVATNLYTAIVTDTGSFRYANTTGDTLRVAAELMEAGADFLSVVENVYEKTPYARMKILGLALETLDVTDNGSIGTMTVTRRMIKEVQAKPEHTEGIVEMIRSIDGVRVAAFFQETEADRFKVSLRSKGDVNVESVARRFGGGGHVNAAACRMAGRLPDVKAQLIDAARSALS